MIGIWLFGACGFGLRPANPDMNQNTDWSSEEQGVENINETEELFEDVEALEEVTTEQQSQFGALEVIQSIPQHPFEAIGQENSLNPDLDNDGDGYSINAGDCNDADNTIFPSNTDLGGDGIDQDCDGVDGLSTQTGCHYTIEMMCGPDGWVDMAMLIEDKSGMMYAHNSHCEHDDQSWYYAQSETVDVYSEPGEELNLQLCENENCTSVLPHTDLGIRIRVNDTLIHERFVVEDSWSLNHVCPL